MTQKDDWQSQEARLGAYLQGLDVGALRKLMLEASLRDDALRQKLLMAATVADCVNHPNTTAHSDPNPTSYSS